MGELFRRRSDDSDPAKAERHYRRAIEKDAAHAPSYNRLGRVYLSVGEADRAAQAFRRYLELAPMAEDREYVRKYIEDVANGHEGALAR